MMLSNGDSSSDGVGDGCIVVTKSLLHYYIIIYPFECETYTNICLQCNRVIVCKV